MFGERLAQLRENKDMNQRELAEALGVTRGAVSMWEIGQRTPDSNTLQKIASFFNVSIDYLLGLTDDPTPPKQSDKQVRLAIARKAMLEAQMKHYPNTIPFDKSRLFLAPVLGIIRGGPPTYAEEEIEGYMYVDPVISGVSEGDELFFLRVKGDSMTPRFQPGDLVLIKRQDSVQPGEVSAVIVNGNEACLKKVYFSGDNLILQSTNPAYEPIIVPAYDCQIIGKAITCYGLVNHK